MANFYGDACIAVVALQVGRVTRGERRQRQRLEDLHDELGGGRIIRRLDSRGQQTEDLTGTADSAACERRIALRRAIAAHVECEIRMTAGPFASTGSQDLPAIAQHSIDRRRPYSDSRHGLRAHIGALLFPLPDRPGWELTTRADIDSVVPEELERAQAQALLSEAQELYASRRERARSAESRATTLQGTVGVAAGLILTGANFVLDPARIADRTWRMALASCLVALLLCLVLSGWLATNANLKIFTWIRPKPAPILRRASQNVAQADRERAVDLIAYANANYYVAVFKIAQIRAAARWFRAALTLLALLALLLAIYVSFGPVPG